MHTFRGNELLRETAAATGRVICDLFSGLESSIWQKNRPLLSGFELVVQPRFSRCQV